jgi:hypothetical protein
MTDPNVAYIACLRCGGQLTDATMPHVCEVDRLRAALEAVRDELDEALAAGSPEEFRAAVFRAEREVRRALARPTRGGEEE